VDVNVVDQGQAQQAIRSISQGHGQVLQAVRLGGDLNQIRNLINLEIQTRNTAVSSSANTQQILSSLRQLSPTTPF
jgi:ABC-type arginine transport system ATPase subunit